MASCAYLIRCIIVSVFDDLHIRFLPVIPVALGLGFPSLLVRDQGLLGSHRAGQLYPEAAIPAKRPDSPGSSAAQPSGTPQWAQQSATL